MPDARTGSPDPEMTTMSFGDHLEELRTRLLWALAAPLPLFVILFFFSDTLVEWLLLPVYDVLRSHELPTRLQLLSPPEILLTELKLSIITALVLSAPWVLWQLWKFIAPGLYMHERRFVHFLLPGSAVLTLAGLALLYWVMLPLMLHVLVLFGTAISVEIDPPSRDPRVEAVLAAGDDVPLRTRSPESPAPGETWLLVPELTLYVAVAGEDDGESADGDEAAPAVEVVTVAPNTPGRLEQTFRVSHVVNFTLILMLGVTIAFQMPLVIVLLGWTGLVSVGDLRRHRRIALGVCGVLAAVITPADALSMVIMLIPLYGLYELGILLLVLAPPSAVAEGRVLRRWGRGPK